MTTVRSEISTPAAQPPFRYILVRQTGSPIALPSYTLIEESEDPVTSRGWHETGGFLCCGGLAVASQGLVGVFPILNLVELDEDDADAHANRIAGTSAGFQPAAVQIRTTAEEFVVPLFGTTLPPIEASVIPGYCRITGTHWSSGCVLEAQVFGTVERSTWIELIRGWNHAATTGANKPTLAVKAKKD